MISPMLCESSKESFDRDGFWFEPKLDGTRVIAVSGKKPSLASRRGNDVSIRYPEIMGILATMPEAILDGEIVVLDRNGVPSFKLLQQRSGKTKPFEVKIAMKQYPAVLYVFDIVKQGDVDLTKSILRDRHAALKSVLSQLPVSGTIRRVMGVEKHGVQLFEACMKMNMEGIVGKRLDSTYQEGKRSADWVKVKKFETEEFVVYGYTEGTGVRQATFGALAIGHYNHDKTFTGVGQVGSGFTNEDVRKVYEALTPTGETEVIDGDKVYKVKRNMVVEVRFMEMTSDNIVRQPVFLRVRHDLNPHFIRGKKR